MLFLDDLRVDVKNCQSQNHAEMLSYCLVSLKYIEMWGYEMILNKFWGQQSTFIFSFLCLL